MATIYIDGRPYQMNPKQNLLHGCLTLGFDLPYFCWHPAMGSVGACRQCAVKQFKDENDNRGKLVMACMTPATEGTRISIADPDAVAFRKGIIEGLMLSHPHDCPVCDEGGECHLQDMTVMTGHDYRRYRYQKRTFRNQNLGPFVNHEMNRCIQCYRCVRFYREYAGGHDLNAFGLRNLVYFGRESDGVLENEFSGNLVEVCPTGVFTDKTLRWHYTRKWDLQMAPSVCVHCGLGCNTTPGERYGMLRRIVNRYNAGVNGYFLCDRGRFGYAFVNSERRIRGPLVKGAPVEREQAIEHLRGLMRKRRVIGIGSPRASLESNFALRALVGAENFYAGVSDAQHRLFAELLGILRAGPARSPSLREIECCDAVLVLGEDVTNVAPRMALALRQSVRRQPMEIAASLQIPLWPDHAVREAVQYEKGPLFLATPGATKLEDVATESVHGAPADIARLGFAVAHAIDASAPAVAGLAPELEALAQRIANAFKTAKRPLVISGVSCGSAAVIQAAANVARSLHAQNLPAALSFTVPECNSFGLAMMAAKPLRAAFESAPDVAIILENDLYRRAPVRSVNEFLDATPHIVALDHLANDTTAQAELVFSAGTFAESDGTFVNSEGRAQRFFQVFVPEGEILESWRWLGSWKNLDEIIDAMSMAVPELSAVVQAAPPATFRMAQQRIAREPHRYSGRTAMLANVTVHEPKPPDDPDSPFSFSMEGNPAQPPAPLVPFFWAPRWNSIQSVNKFQEEIGGPLRSGPSGVRLIEPAADGRAPYFSDVPEAFAPRPDEWLHVPLFHIFGSDELSIHSTGIAELAPKPYLALNPEDAERLGLHAGDEIEMLSRVVAIRIDPGLPMGVAGLPAGMEPARGINLPAWARIAPK